MKTRLPVKSPLFSFFFILTTWYAVASDPGGVSSHFTEVPPSIDGLLNEELWSSSKSVSGFTTFVPDFSKEMALKTTAYWAHDEDNLYFAFRCEDDPSLIKTSTAARDKIRADDWVCINLDSFNDRQTLYGFYINPNGIQMDSRFAGGRDDDGIDMVWYSAGSIDEKGYSVEVKIPFKSIRYAVKDGNVDMGVIFERKISRLSTQGTYPALDPNQGFNFLTQTMPIHFTGVKKNVLFELLPAVTHARSKVHEEGSYSRDQATELSLTSKFGITSDLIVDATYNPDFSQVEADALQVQVNQRFPVFFPERRPFFQEGVEHLRQAGGGREIRSIVNTRSIANPLAAGKISGKVGQSNIVSAIGAIDELDTTYNANVGVFRYKRAFQRDSFLGGIWTGRSEDQSVNTVFGLDGQWRVSDAELVSGYMFNSANRDSLGEEIANDQAAAFNYSYRNRNISIGGGITEIETDFKSDVGYITRTGITKYNVFYSPKFYPDRNLIKRVEPLIYVSLSKDKPSGLYESSIYSRLEMTLPRNTNIEIGGNVSDEIYEGHRFDRSSLSLEGRSQLNRRVFLSVDYDLRKRPYYSDLEQGYGNSFRARLGLQLNDNFNATINYSYSDLFSSATNENYYRIHLLNARNTYQINKYLFIRAIVQYDSNDQILTPNFLASFTYIPGTVVHIGYGSVMDRTKWDRVADEYVNSRNFLEVNGGLFFKASYLWRM